MTLASKPRPTTAEEVEAAVVDLVPLLRANASLAEQQRSVPQENIDALEAAGVFRISTPRHHGGLELDLTAQVRILAAVARGCGSTAWVCSLHSVASYFLGLFDDRAQDAVFTSPDVRSASIFSPGGVLTPVEGGYRLTGRWPFNTGCRSAQWDTLAARLDDPAGGPPQMLLCLVSMSDLTIEDDWHPSGLAGTGSNATVAKDVFVPSHWVLPLMGALTGTNLSAKTAGSPLYRAAFFPFVLVNSTGAPVGMAEGALDTFLERLPGRKITYTNWVQSEAQVTHIGVADAAVNIRAAKVLSHDLATRIGDAAREGRDLDVAERAAMRAEAAHVVRLSRLAIEQLNSMSGASSIQSDVPIQRIFRDIEALTLHAALALNTNLEVHGRVLVGLDPATPFL
ncbi:acyl-CoA dehydrogenase family protein [Pseudonocardia sp. NPDC049635]|uniref:acyl-CoA dehydrogenase family protein n=1 Tax=Pseudonocardia sp. NPDC049635 TaxID=3155506 RepID=UPI0033F3E345